MIIISVDNYWLTVRLKIDQYNKKLVIIVFWVRNFIAFTLLLARKSKIRFFFKRREVRFKWYPQDFQHML